MKILYIVLTKGRKLNSLAVFRCYTSKKEATVQKKRLELALKNERTDEEVFVYRYDLNGEVPDKSEIN